MTPTSPDERPGERTPPPADEVVYIRRFGRAESLMHGLLMASFLGLSLTGLPLLFAGAAWAARMAALFGGYGVTGNLHRTFALLLLATFATHVGRLVKRLYVDKDMGILWGPESLVPQPRDLVQMLQHFSWFLGVGPRPRFDRFTYWEKFDYWAVFWGMGIIGTSGLMLWFPGVFSAILPGWAFNVALLVHGEEALLAMVFIFTVHFFNGHVRPEKFPMDTVIFTGRLRLEELRHERPAEYERLVATGRLDSVRAPAPARRTVLLGRAAGSVALTVGGIMVVLTVYALLH